MDLVLKDIDGREAAEMFPVVFGMAYGSKSGLFVSLKDALTPKYKEICEAQGVDPNEAIAALNKHCQKVTGKAANVPPVIDQKMIDQISKNLK